MKATKIAPPPELVEELQKLRENFCNKFGRDPGPDDPVFFDPYEDKPVPMKSEEVRAALLEAIERAEVPEAKIREVLRRWENNEPWILGKPAAKAIERKPRCPSGDHQSDRGERPAGGPARKKSHL